MGLRAMIGVALAVTALTGCALPIMDATASFVRSGAGRPSQAQVFDGFAMQRAQAQQAYSRGIVAGPNDPIYGDQAPFWFGHGRY